MYPNYYRCYPMEKLDITLTYTLEQKAIDENLSFKEIKLGFEKTVRIGREVMNIKILSKMVIVSFKLDVF
jgi:hypothetical protein